MRRVRVRVGGQGQGWILRRATPLGSVEATETCCSASIAPLCLSMALKPSESCGAKRYSERVCEGQG